MNRVNVLCTLVLLGLLVSPSLTLPADPTKIESTESETGDAEMKDPTSNEIGKDVETFKPENSSTEPAVEHHSVESVSTGIISRFGYDGECKY